jgi:hypothetical protein
LERKEINEKATKRCAIRTRAAAFSLGPRKLVAWGTYPLFWRPQMNKEKLSVFLDCPVML